MKPWIKATSAGKIYIDKSHPGFTKWFIEQVKKYAGLIKIKKPQ